MPNEWHDIKRVEYFQARKMDFAGCMKCPVTGQSWEFGDEWYVVRDAKTGTIVATMSSEALNDKYEFLPVAQERTKSAYGGITRA